MAGFALAELTSWRGHQPGACFDDALKLGVLSGRPGRRFHRC
jgi:hypothetical protein